MRRLRNAGNDRKKAFWGALAAAGISTIGSLFGSKKEVDSTLKAAELQAQATRDAAKEQADAIQKQTENDNKLQSESLQETRSMNAENRRIQEDANMSLKLMTASNDYEQRLKRSERALKAGGSVGRFSLRGSHNIPFKVTDGGGVIYEGSTPEGYDLYEIYGNDHEHSHKTKGGKRKTGVGFKFGGSQVVEGEGNQNTNFGEKLLVTPDDALFISKHSMNGFNPAKAVDAGMNPLRAFAVQENIKKNNNMRNNKRRFTVGGLYPTDTIYYPITQNNNSIIAPAAALAVKRNRQLKRGGRIKAKLGFADAAPFIGAGVSTFGSLLGAGITSRANTKAANMLSNAYNQASQYMIDAYNQMHGIDMSEIKKEDYEAAQAMANTRAAIVNVNPQLEAVNRTARRQIKGVNNSTLSSAARLNRIAAIEDAAYANKGQIYADQANREAAIGRENLQQINEAERLNAQLRSQANKDYTNARLALLQYNNDIENSKISGIGQARADAITNSTTALANARTQNGAIWNQAISSSASSIGNAFNTYATNKATKDATMAGAGEMTLGEFNATTQGIANQNPLITMKMGGVSENTPTENTSSSSSTIIPYTPKMVQIDAVEPIPSKYLFPWNTGYIKPNTKAPVWGGISYKRGGRLRRTLK